MPGTHNAFQADFASFLMFQVLCLVERQFFYQINFIEWQNRLNAEPLTVLIHKK